MMYLMDLPFYSFTEEPFSKSSPLSLLDNIDITVSAILQLHAQSSPAWSRPPEHAPFPFATGLRPRIHFQQRYWICWWLTYLCCIHQRERIMSRSLLAPSSSPVKALVRTCASLFCNSSLNWGASSPQQHQV